MSDSLHDVAQVILDDAPLSNGAREALWDAFHSDISVQELAEYLNQITLPSGIATALLNAKQRMTPEAAPAPAAHPSTAAIEHMASIDKTVLDIAENHPAVLRILINSLPKDEVHQ